MDTPTDTPQRAESRPEAPTPSSASLRRVPLIILGGRDRKESALPESGRDKHVLEGYKAVDVRVGDRPLIVEAISRLRAVGAFEPVYIAGPGTVYDGLVDDDVRIIETDGGFGKNLATCAEFLAEHHPGEQVMFTTCDILADRDELATALDDYFDHRPLDFWMPQCRVPDDLSELGQSSYKPKYVLRREGEPKATRVLPGHLIAVDPEITHCDLVCRFLGGLYRTRNRSIAARGRVVAVRVIRELLLADLRQLFRLRWPSITWNVLFHSLGLARKLARGTATVEDFEVRLRHIFLKTEHRRKFPEQRGRVAILDGLSLAKDIDTVEEARELSAGPSAGQAAT